MAPDPTPALAPEALLHIWSARRCGSGAANLEHATSRFADLATGGGTSVAANAHDRTEGERHEVHLLPLMPYRDLPEDFETTLRERLGDAAEQRAVRPAESGPVLQVEPRRTRAADRLGYDGVGVNEHHQNAYGFMASPNLMAASLPRRTPNDSAILVLGNTLALYNPAMRVAEEFAMLDCMSGGRLVGRLSGGHADGRQTLLRHHPDRDAAALLRSARPDHEGVDAARAVPLQRPVQQAALREPVAAAASEPHPPVWLAGGGSVETWEMAGATTTPTAT